MSIVNPWVTLGHLFSVNELSDLWSGWIDLQSFASVTFAYNSADSPTFVMSSNVDLTNILQPGQRVQLVQSSTTKYFIVTAVSAYAAGTMTITLLAPNDGTTLANVSITACAFSSDKAPFGFPTDPTKWFWQTKDTSDRSQAAATVSTWYNVGSLSLVIPIGAWRVLYEVAGETSTSGVASDILTTLSTANNSQSDSDFTSWGLVNGSLFTILHTYREKALTLASKTTYFLNAQWQNGTAPTSLHYRGDNAPTIIRASCAYL